MVTSMITLDGESAARRGGSNPPFRTNIYNPLLTSNVERYLQELAFFRKSSTENRARQILFEYLPFADDANPDPRSGILAYLSHCREIGNSDHTLENKRIRLAAFYRSMGSAKLTIPRIKYTLPKPEMYSQAEIDLLLAHATGRDKLMWQTYLMSGLRMQEMMHLEFSNLLDTGIEVAAHGDWTPKDHEVRVVKVPKSLIAELRSLPRVGDGNLVFPSQWGNVNWHHLRSIKRCAARAGMDPQTVWLHKFRGTFCSRLLRHQVGLPEIMHAMGHSSLKSTMRYLVLIGDHDLQSKIEAVWAV